MMMDDKNARDYHQPYEPTVLERGDQVCALKTAFYIHSEEASL